MPSLGFTELQDKFLRTSSQLQSAQTDTLKLQLLNELERIVAESKRALMEMATKNSK